MKLLMTIFLIASALHSSLGFTKELKGQKVKKSSVIDYQPLRTSEWFKENPDLLPYSKCTIEEPINGRAHRFEAGVIISSAIPNRSIYFLGDYLLVCRTPKLKLIFAIPISLERNWSIGPQAMWMVGEAHYKVYKLAGNPVINLFDEYGGIEAGFGIVGSVTGGVYGNHSDIRVRHGRYGVGFGLKAGYSEFRMVYRSPKVREIVDPRIIPLDIDVNGLPKEIIPYKSHDLVFRKF